jgi:hypothetical protein
LKEQKVNKRTILIGILITLMLISTVPLYAQDDGLTDEQLTEMVVNAYANLNDLNSFTFNSRQEENQVISSGVGVRRVSLVRSTTRNITSGRLIAGESGAPDNVDANLLQTDTIYVNDDLVNAVELTLDLRLIAIDDSVYVQINDITGSFVAQLSDANSVAVEESLPTGWVILAGTAAPENNILSADSLADTLSILNRDGEPSLSVDSLDFNSLLRVSNSFQITGDMILSIRVAEPDVDDEYLDESEDDLIIIVEIDAAKAFGSLGLENVFNADALAGDPAAMLQQIIGSMTITQRIRLIEQGTDPVVLYPDQVVTTMTIGSEDEDSETLLPVEFSEDNTDGTPLALSMRLESRTRYGSFGTAAAITAPLNEPASE